MAVYAPVRQHDFVQFDDNRYVTANAHVLDGLSLPNLVWAFTTTHASNWHPLTWISHMLDVELFGPGPAGPHATNLALHALSTVLLFALLLRMTGMRGRSALVAGLFALHPLHVESVAWISERKDVLSAAFGLITLHLYVSHARHPSRKSATAVAVSFALGLMAKPMLVTLPFVMMLLDVWPLRRRSRWLLRGKLSLLVLSGLSCLITIQAHRSSGTLPDFETFPLDVRIANALVAYLAYLGKTLWPLGLAVHYPHPESVPFWKATGAAVVLLGISAGVLRLRGTGPYLLVGWLWYLGMLVPVIGLVQVGPQAMADRYTYLPSIGLFLALAWGAAELGPREGSARRGRSALAVAAVVACVPLTWRQLGYWKDTTTLFEHALAVTERNALAHVVLGNQLTARGSPQAAIRHLEAAIAIEPDYAMAWNNLGTAQRRLGRIDAAIRALETSLRADPGYALAHYNLGEILQAQGRTDEAIERYRRALELDPRLVDAHSNLAILLVAKGQPDEALAHFREALRIDPRYANGHYNLGNALLISGRVREAIPHLERALELDPRHPMAAQQLVRARRRVHSVQ
ncbi:MAG: tetratricopeptide repeat protein [Myxococcota bacterium]